MWIAASEFYFQFFPQKFPINLSKSQYRTHFNRIDSQVIVKMAVSYKPKVFASTKENPCMSLSIDGADVLRFHRKLCLTNI